MTPTLARRILAAAVVLGVTGDYLLRADMARLGFVLWVVLTVLVAVLVTAPEAAVARSRERLMLLGATALASLLLVLRDAEMLYVLDMLAILSFGALVTWRALGRGLATFRYEDAVLAWASAAWATVVGVPTLVTRDQKTDAATPESGRDVRAAIVGTALALPVLALVAGLLGNADPVFGALVERVEEFLATDFMGHLLGSAAAAWLVAGWLRGGLVATRPKLPLGEITPPRATFPVLAPGLYGLVVILTAYLGVQARVLFGGATYVEVTSGLSFADYARSGFFELVMVTAIVLAVMMVSDRLLDERDESVSNRFRLVGWVLLALVGVLMASAMQRMGLYVSFYGLSADRVFATAVMLLIAVALGWFGWTVLRGQPVRFVPGMIVAMTAWGLALNALNPEALVVRVNVARAEAGKSFDAPYHALLSADALPELIAGAPRLSAADCADLVTRLRGAWETRAAKYGDWRGWNLPYARAVSPRHYSATALSTDLCRPSTPLPAP